MNYDDLKLQILLKQQQKNNNDNSVNNNDNSVNNNDNSVNVVEKSVRGGDGPHSGQHPVNNNNLIVKKSASANLNDVEVFDEQGNFKPPLQPLIISVIGKPSTGKSYFIKSLMYYYLKQNYFKFGMVISRTKFNGDYDWCPDEYVKDEYDEQKLQQYINKLKMYKKSKGYVPPSFLILDDVLGAVSVYSNFWTQLISQFRHFNLTLIIASQSITSKLTSTLLRECVNISVMFRSVFKNTIVALFESFGQLFENYDEFLNLYLKITAQKYHALLFINDKDSKEQSYFDYIAPPNTPEFKIKF